MNSHPPSEALVKRGLDVLVSLLALAVLWPALAVLAALVAWEDGRPVFFRQRRAGQFGRPFVMWKFRTMRKSADPYGRSPTGGDDPRLTRVGRFLRETSLDELPQLFNVVFGTMSLVGPRPLYERQAAQWNARQRRRLDAPPGVTGWAQVIGRADLPIEDKIELDLWYVDHRSLKLDLEILWKTAWQAVGRRGEVYEKRYSREHEREPI